jgi:hypothetical protein
MVGVCILERQSASLRKPNEADEAPLAEFLPGEGESVHDESMAAVFRVGDSYLSLDGIRFQTVEPVLLPPRAELPEVMQGATQTRLQPQSHRRANGFYAAETAVLLAPEIPQQIILTCLQPGDEPPPAPAITVPNRVDALLQKWRLVYPQDVASSRSARWQAEVIVTSHNPDLPPRTHMKIELPNHTPIKIDLTGRPVY